jgi:hypothetical protein
MGIVLDRGFNVGGNCCRGGDMSEIEQGISGLCDSIGELRDSLAAKDAEIARLREALEKLLIAAKLLQANSEGCVVNHYSEDFSLHGLPGFLLDTSADIEAARAALDGKP